MFYGVSLGRSFDSSAGYFELGASSKRLSGSLQYGFITTHLKQDTLYLTPIMMQITAKTGRIGRIRGIVGGGLGWAFTDYDLDRQTLKYDEMRGYRVETYVDPAPIYKVTGGIECFLDHFSIVFSLSEFFFDSKFHYNRENVRTLRPFWLNDPVKAVNLDFLVGYLGVRYYY